MKSWPWLLRGGLVYFPTLFFTPVLVSGEQTAVQNQVRLPTQIQQQTQLFCCHTVSPSFTCTKAEEQQEHQFPSLEAIGIH